MIKTEGKCYENDYQAVNPTTKKDD